KRPTASLTEALAAPGRRGGDLATADRGGAELLTWRTANGGRGGSGTRQTGSGGRGEAPGGVQLRRRGLNRRLDGEPRARRRFRREALGESWRGENEGVGLIRRVRGGL